MPPKKINFNVRERLEDDKLDLSMSELEEVPVRDIAQIKKATSLDLSNNHLKSLGKNFATLTHLIKLDLSKNCLTKLPENFGDLILLKHLDLYSNQLTYLPLTFGQLKNLRWLDLKNNPLLPAVLEVAGPCLDNQQCQKCAKNVVLFFQEIHKEVEVEKERRLQLKRKQQEKEAEIAAQNLKKEQQKKKKKNSKSGSNSQAKEGNGIKYVHNSPTEEREADEKRTQSVKEKSKKSGSGVFWILKQMMKLSLFVSLILMLGFFGLYIINEQAYHDMKTKLEKFSGSVLNELPTGIVDKVTVFSQTIQPYVNSTVVKLDAWSREAVSGTKAFYIWLSEKKVVQHAVTSLCTCCDAIFHLLCDMYRTIDKQIPIYLDMVKKKLFS